MCYNGDASHGSTSLPPVARSQSQGALRPQQQHGQGGGLRPSTMRRPQACTSTGYVSQHADVPSRKFKQTTHALSYADEQLLANEDTDVESVGKTVLNGPQRLDSNRENTHPNAESFGGRRYGCRPGSRSSSRSGSLQGSRAGSRPASATMPCNVPDVPPSPQYRRIILGEKRDMPLRMARDILAALKEDASIFDECQRRFSDYPSEPVMELGAGMPLDLEQLAADMQPGEISEVIATDAGMQILRRVA